MRIQYCSDLHLEFDGNNKYLLQNPLPVKGDILLLAGDIVPLLDEFINHTFFSYIADNYKQVFWIPGNHEFYYKDVSEYRKSCHISLKSNVSVVNNMEMEYEGIHFVFSTLWSKISPDNEKIIEQGVSDFECITYKGRRFKAADFNKLHADSLDFMKQSLLVKKDKTVVVTHHIPSLLCNSKIHNSSNINEAFCVDLTNFIENCGANFWLYGHSHFNQKPVYLGNTILLTNQLGYIHLGEQNTFMPNAYFSI